MTLVMVVRSSSESWSRSARRASTWLLGALSGPMIQLTVDGHGPGGQVSPLALHTVRVLVQAPGWIPLSEVALYTTGGVELGRWPVTAEDGDRLDLSLRTALPTGWIVAAAWGDTANPPLLDAPAWAITSPVWVGRP